MWWIVTLQLLTSLNRTEKVVGASTWWWWRIGKCTDEQVGLGEAGVGFGFLMFCGFETGRTGYIVRDRLMPESGLHRCSFWHINCKICAKTAWQTHLMRNQYLANVGNQHNTHACMGGSVLLGLRGVFVVVGSSKKWRLLLEVRLSFGSDPAQYVAFQITQAQGSKEAKSTVLDVLALEKLMASAVVLNASP